MSFDLLREALEHPIKSPVFDSVDGKAESETVSKAAADYASKDLAVKAVAAIQEWSETDDLAEGEGYSDRLMAMFIAIADENKDGELTEAEQAVIETALESAYEYLVSKGVSEEDASLLLNDWDEDAADRVRDLVAAELPDSEDAAADDLNNFVFSESDQEPAYDAVYKKTFAIRHGKKVRINKRISGTVRLSPKQKVAIRRASMKSHSAAAIMRRMKSMRMRRRAGL